MRALLFLAAAPVALAFPSMPVAAQSHQHMPGMTMPAAQPTPKPVAKPKPAVKKARPRPKPRARAAAPATPSPAPATSPHADHQVMTGMPDMPDMPGMSGRDHSSHGAMPMAGDQDHAGHDMQGMAGQKSGTDLPPGNAAPPPVQPGRPADRYFGAQAMADAEKALLNSHGGMVFSQFLLNLAEYQARGGRDGYRWDSEFWVGGDRNRLVLKSEGEGRIGDRLDSAEAQALYSRALDPYWNLQAGIRQDFRPRPARTYAVLGVEGIAPYWIATDGALFLSDKGDLLGRATVSYDQRITQRLILQPRGEANFALQDMPRDRIGAGLSNLELGLRLRYEVEREFAPYLGVSWERRLGRTADYARAAGEDTGGVSFVAGVRAWF